MKFIALLLFLFLSIFVLGQEVKEPSRLPLVPYGPSVEGVNHLNRISINFIQENGLRLVLADKTYKVIQFDVIYDCHSRSLVDFSVKRYFGDKVDSQDEYLRKRILAGDIMDIVNTVIEKNGRRYCMKGFAFVVTN